MNDLKDTIDRLKVVYDTNQIEIAKLSFRLNNLRAYQKVVLSTIDEKEHILKTLKGEQS